VYTGALPLTMAHRRLAGREVVLRDAWFVFDCQNPQCKVPPKRWPEQVLAVELRKAWDEGGFAVTWGPSTRRATLRPTVPVCSAQRGGLPQDGAGQGAGLGDSPGSSSRTSIACMCVGVSLLNRTVPTCGVIQWSVIHRYRVTVSSVTVPGTTWPSHHAMNTETMDA
jgi:hypothetical protein